MENHLLIQACAAKAQQWVDSPLYDAETRRAVAALLADADPTELVNAFYQNLEFGTSGLRGLMGVGTNRMNVYVVGLATQGLADYLLQSFAHLPEISVVVCHDCRNHSREFARTAANVFSANGIRVYLFDDMRPTPEVSFAIRQLGCQSGVNITASHNPKEYNGYKAYWDDGAQVTSPHDKAIVEAAARVCIEDVRFEGNPALIHLIGEEMDRRYLDEVRKVSIDPEVVRRQHDLKIVYSPLHGTGMKLIPRCLREWGFDEVYCVPEQMVADGNFPTVKFPNPEYPEALDLAIRLADEKGADFVMASDPDADRVGMACKDHRGVWTYIDGHQTSLIFFYYIIKHRKDRGEMTGTEYAVKTIVTSDLIKTIAERNGVQLYDTYTGDKWMAWVIAQNYGRRDFLGGGEESYGFMATDEVRDKDAVSACALLAEICAWAREQGKTLYDVLMDIYVEYGCVHHYATSLTKPGKSGAEEIARLMEHYRSQRPTALAGSPVVCSRDFLTLTTTDAQGRTQPLDMPETSNVLQWYTADGSKVSVRPSGTEPKIKFYIEAAAPMPHAEDYPAALAQAKAKVEAIKVDLGLG